MEGLPREDRADRPLHGGADLKAFIDEDEKRTRKVYEEEGWLVN